MDQKLNVCLLNDSFPPQIDGVANTVVNYASIIERKYGHAIVATPQYPNVTDDYPFEVLRYPSIDTTRLVGYRAGMPLSMKYASQYVSKDIDILHSHCPIASNFMGRILRDTIRKPMILTYHTKFDIDIKRTVDAKLIQDAAIDLMISNISAADEVWTVSRGAGENLKSLGYKGEYLVMTNGVDFEKGTKPKSNIDAVRKEYGIPTDRPVYLFVGRLMWYKGIKIILDALKILAKENRQFCMLFVGNGLEKEEIEKYAADLDLADKCIFTGPVRDREKLKTLYCCGNLFLFPSTFDTNGIVVREAAASYLGSILIKDSCAAEDVTDGRNALLIEENADSLARKLLEIGDNYQFMETLGRNAANDLYTSWEESVDRAVERYRYVIENYQYKKPNLLDTSSTMLDNFFSLYGDLAFSLDKARHIRQTIGERINGNLDFFERPDRWL